MAEEEVCLLIDEYFETNLEFASQNFTNPMATHTSSQGVRCLTNVFSWAKFTRLIIYFK